MSALRKIPTSFFQILAIVLALGLGFWQYRLVADRNAPEPDAQDASVIHFTMNDGSRMSLPADDTTKINILLFWSVDSERSIAQAVEMAEIIASGEFDSVFSFYIINPVNTPEDMRRMVDFDDLSIPFAYDPSGSLLDEKEIRSLPVTMYLMPDGKFISRVDGYQAGELKLQLTQLLGSRRYLSPDGSFQFRVD